MNKMDQSLLEAAHKNVILWKLMHQCYVTSINVHHNAKTHASEFSFGINSLKKMSHYAYRLKTIDKHFACHTYKTSNSIFSSFDRLDLFPTTSSRELVYARAAFLDALMNDFKYGFAWRDFMFFEKTDSLSAKCVEIDLNFNDNDIEMEKSIINCIELNECLKKAPPLSLLV